MVAGVAAGEPHEGPGRTVRQVEERWGRLGQVLADTQRVVDRNVETKKFRSELAALRDLLAGYEKWVGASDRVAEDAQEISKQLDQCKVSDGGMSSCQ